MIHCFFWPIGVQFLFNLYEVVECGSCVRFFLLIFIYYWSMADRCQIVCSLFAGWSSCWCACEHVDWNLIKYVEYLLKIVWMIMTKLLPLLIVPLCLLITRRVSRAELIDWTWFLEIQLLIRSALSAFIFWCKLKEIISATLSSTFLKYLPFCSVMYILCNEEPLWMSICLDIANRQLQYKGSWKRTALDQYGYS